MPEIDGVDGPVQIVGDLSVGPDGLIWGVLDGFIDPANGFDAAIFAMNPDTLEIVKSKVITRSPYSTSKYRPYYIRFSDDGLMYTTIGRKLFAINPETLQSKEMLPGTTVNLMTMADNGDIYYVNGSKLFKLPKVKTPAELSITEIEKLNPLEVEFGTKKEEVNLPETVKVTLSDDTTVDVSVTWNNGNPAYDGNKSGVYIFNGVLDLPPSILNPDGLEAVVNVVVLEAPEQSADLLLAELAGHLAAYIDTNEVRGPLVNQLRNSLKQAEHHLNKGSNGKAADFIEKFLKHINNKAHAKPYYG